MHILTWNFVDCAKWPQNSESPYNGQIVTALDCFLNKAKKNKWIGALHYFDDWYNNESNLMPYIFQYGLPFPLLLGLSNFHPNLSPIVFTKTVYFPMKNVVWRGETSAVTNQTDLREKETVLSSIVCAANQVKVSFLVDKCIFLWKKIHRFITLINDLSYTNFQS